MSSLNIAAMVCRVAGKGLQFDGIDVLNAFKVGAEDDPVLVGREVCCCATADGSGFSAMSVSR